MWNKQKKCETKNIALEQERGVGPTQKFITNKYAVAAHPPFPSPQDSAIQSIP